MATVEVAPNPPLSPFSKGGFCQGNQFPLFEKEGSGEILEAAMKH
jgi:hypothetical protein